MMAKEKDVKPVEVEKTEVEGKEEKPLVQPELEFVCRMCLAGQGKPGARSSDCIMKNARGVLCPKMQELNDLIISLKTENELHDKYLKAFNTQPYFTKEEIHELYLGLFNEKKQMSFEEFCDYLRQADYIIV